MGWSRIARKFLSWGPLLALLEGCKGMFGMRSLVDLVCLLPSLFLFSFFFFFFFSFLFLPLFCSSLSFCEYRGFEDIKEAGWCYLTLGLPSITRYRSVSRGKLAANAAHDYHATSYCTDSVCSSYKQLQIIDFHLFIQLYYGSLVPFLIVC